MPTYEYECQRCGNSFERFQNITEDPVKRCPECRGKVRRLLGTGAGIIFKGSGFYGTDYRSENYKKRANEESKGAEQASSHSQPTTKSDNKTKTTQTEKKTA